MNKITSHTIKTGSDPRALPDYTALRDELSKLAHPARPDVNWQYVEKLCLSLFELNGVELQTAAWYTLARTQLTGFSGLNEGLAILEALIRYQWGVLWPQPVHARMEILSSLSQRLQQRMRSLPLNYSDLGQLYQAEQLLIRMEEVLQCLELKHISQLDALRTLMHNSAVRLESLDETTCIGPTIQSTMTLPATEINGAAISTDSHDDSSSEGMSDSSVKRVFVAEPNYQPNEKAPAAMLTSVKKWKSFAAGMGTMLVISTTAVWGWHYVHQSDPLQVQLAASLAPLPAVLTPEQLNILRQQSTLPQDLITQTRQQLIRLEKLSPGWNIDYSQQLLAQAQALWSEQAEPLVQQWQQQIAISALSVDAMNGWHEGMLTLQELTTRLNALDSQKGKYMTVSELKSQVFAATQAFSKTVPVEEQLRQMSIQQNPEMIPSTQKIQTEQHLKQLITRYYSFHRSSTST